MSKSEKTNKRGRDTAGMKPVSALREFSVGGGGQGVGGGQQSKVVGPGGSDAA